MTIRRFSLILLIIISSILAVISAESLEIKRDQKRMAQIAAMLGPGYAKLLDKKFLEESAAEIKKLHAPAGYKANDDLIPLIIVPSLLGSKILAKLSKNHTAHHYCEKHTKNFFTLWLAETSFTPMKFDCFIEDASMYYAKGKLSNYPGVETKIEDVGGVSSIDYIDALRVVGIWNEVVKLLKTYGYKDHHNLRAFPYDWRIAPLRRNGPTYSKPKSADSLDIWEQFAALKELTEQTYEINGQKKVAFTTLSMGGTWLALFFTHFVDAAWKEKYVHSFTSYCSPWAGSSVAVQFNLAPPKHQWIPVVPVPRAFKGFSQHIPSAAWLWPRTTGYGKQVIVKTPKREITANVTEVVKMWESMKEYNLAELHQQIEPFGEPKAPGVRHICVYSSNLNTTSYLEFHTDDLNDDAFNVKHPPTVHNEDGDSTVLVKSLEVCKKWKGTEVHNIPDVGHGSDMHDKRNIKVLMNVLNLKYDPKN